MAGLIVIGITALWLFFAAKIARRISNWCPMRRVSGSLGLIVFLFVAALPFADELVGRWQFQNLCKSHAVIWVHPDASKVTAARDNPRSTDLAGFAIPIQEQAVEYIDSSSGDPFFRYKAFHTPGGFIMRAGLNMGNSTSCWPERLSEPYRTLKIDELLKRGKT
jgi:hypothetical protein